MAWRRASSPSTVTRSPGALWCATRRGLLRKLLLPLNLLRGFWQALGELRRIKPDVVLGMGGYVTFPGGMMAALLGVRWWCMSRIRWPGCQPRVGRVADKVVTGFPERLAKGEWAGNPVRAEIAALSAPEPVSKAAAGPCGCSWWAAAWSQGAQRHGPGGARADRRGQPPVVTHQAGAKQIEALRDNHARAGVEGELLAFIDNMAERYAEADVVLCRAGALTVAELAVAGAASILVPLPHAVDDHQTGNARFLADRGGAILLPQPQFSAERLAELLGSLTRERLLGMALQARALARPDATSKVAAVCEAAASTGKP